MNSETIAELEAVKLRIKQLENQFKVVESTWRFRGVTKLQVYKYVQEHPGQTTTKIGKAFKVERSSVYNALVFLRINELVRSEVLGKQGTPSWEARWYDIG